MIANKDLQLITSSIGKRKRAVAFVELYEIKDNANPFTLINGIPPALYLQFNSQSLNTIFLPLEILNLKNSFNLSIKVKGGGLIGQTDAIKLAISRDSFRELGKISKAFSLRLLESGVFSLVTLSKLIFEDNNSVLALIKLAFAPARDDSDCAKSVRLISPF